MLAGVIRWSNERGGPLTPASVCKIVPRASTSNRIPFLHELRAALVCRPANNGRDSELLFFCLFRVITLTQFCISAPNLKWLFTSQKIKLFFALRAIVCE